MPITVKHSKTSAIPDAGDSTLVQPSDWNADHTLTGLGTMAEQNANAVAITGGTISGVTYTGYTIDGLSYRDMANGFTQITGQTANYYSSLPSGYTTGDATNFATEYVINKVLTRNEHFLGFIEEPRVYSDIFVDRGKQGVSEKNLRLTEIDNLGELSIYGNGFFKVRKQ